MPDIVAIGEALIELAADEPIAIAPALAKSYGGDAIAALVTAARLGSQVGFVSRVGRDPFEHFLIDSWTAEGIDVSHVRLIEGHNGMYVVSRLPGGEREFAYYRLGSAASTMTSADLDPAYLRSAKIVYTTGITQAISASCRTAVADAARLVRGQGPLFAYDPNFRPGLWSAADARAALNEIMPYIDIILPSAPEEIFELTDVNDPAEAIDYFWSHGIKIVAITLGREGCLVGANRQITHVPAFRPGTPIDRTGVGAVFDGAFLHGIARGQDPVDAAHLAVRCAGLAVRGRGAVRGLPPREELAVSTRR